MGALKLSAKADVNRDFCTLFINKLYLAAHIFNGVDRAIINFIGQGQKIIVGILI